MKYFALFALLGFVAAVFANPSSPVLTSSDLQSRDSWEEQYLQARDLASKYHLEERDDISDVALIARSFGSEELSERDYVSDEVLIARYLGEVLGEREYTPDEVLVARYIGSEELSGREYSELEERNPIVVRVAVQAIKLIVKAIRAGIEKDKKMRGEWSKHMIAQFRQKYPHHNFVVCHTKHSTDFKGVQGKDWGHSHQELDVKMGGTIGFEIYWFGEGTFHRQGDGGYLNWAYGGNVKSKSNGDKDVVFGKI